MSWESLVCISFLYQYGLVQIAIKKIGSTEGSRTRKLVWQFFFAALFAFITAIIAGQFHLSWLVMFIAITGIAMPLGVIATGAPMTSQCHVRPCLVI